MSRDKINQIYEAARRTNRAYEIWAEKYGLTMYEMQIYYVMLENGSQTITQKELCTQLDAPKTSINSIIKRQLNAGRIEMSVNPDNKREKIIILTKEGKALAEKVILPLFDCEQKAAEKISDKKLETAIEVQTAFAKNLLDAIGE